MPDEEIVQLEADDGQPDETQEIDGQSEGQEPEGEESEDQTEPSEAQLLWEKKNGDLGLNYKDLTPEQRELVALKRQTAQPGDRPAKEDSGKAASSTDAAEDQTPPVAQLPRIDTDAFRAQIIEATESMDGAAMAKTMLEAVQTTDSLAEVMLAALKEQDNVIASLRADIQRPGRFKDALSQVPGATEADFANAGKLLANGDVTSEVAALKLAAFDRQAEAASVKGSSAPARAKRKANAITASSQSKSASAGEPERRIPTNATQWEERLKEDARRAALAR